MNGLLQDVRYALRQLRKNPGFTATVVITLALGIVANTAIFSVVDRVLLRPLPYRDPASLVWATERFAPMPGFAQVVSPDFAAWKSGGHVFEQIAAFGGGMGANLTGTGEPARVSVTNITAELFSMLGVQPIAGRAFLPIEGTQSHGHVALLNEALWRTRFGADSHIIGKSVELDGTGYTIVGVMPADIRYPRADVWTPLALDAEAFSAHSPRWTILTVVGRLKPGFGSRQAQAELQLITEQMDREYPPPAAPFRAHERVEVIPLHELFVQNVRSLLIILLGATGFVLLIACANVANLLLSRGIVRSKEVTVRAVLGAGRMRLIRQLLTEGMLLALAGTALGCFAGLWGTRILEWLIPTTLPSDIHLNIQIFGFSVAVATLTLLGFGFAPAWIASHTDVSQGLKEAGMRSSSRLATRRLQSLTSVGEVALSLILLVGAGLLTRSFLRLTEVDLGFDPNGVLVATVERPLTIAFDSQRHGAFFQSALERVRSLPGVTEAALTTFHPLGRPHNSTLMLNVQGAENARLPQPVSVVAASANYFHVMKTGMLKGRSFNESDGDGAPKVAIVNASLAKMLFKSGNPLGQHISFGPPPAPWKEVVGVVADMRENGLEGEPVPELFVPYLQDPSFSMAFVIRAGSNPEKLIGEVRQAVQSVDSNQPLSDATTLNQIIAGSIAPRRFKMLLLGMFALLAFALAAIGVYGVTAYFCSQRIHEFGVRTALGAGRTEILKLSLGRGLKLVLVGVALGVAGAFALTRFISSLLFAVKPTDPVTFVAVSAGLAIAGLLASYIPARRVANVDPMVALRYE
jgi:putative ABC transport system permease protein